MNYAAHYARLIERALGRMLPGYKERHHVLPLCMGGTNAKDNLVGLTAEEHYVAHQLLVKMHPGVRGLATAAVRMAKQCTGNKAYGWLRRLHAAALRGRKIHPEAIAKIAAKNVGRPVSEDTRAKISAAMRNRSFSPDHVENLKRAWSTKRNRVLSAEARAKISAAQLGKTMSPQARARMSAVRQAHEARRKAEGLRRTLTPEHRAKISAWNVARWARVRSLTAGGGA